MKKKNTKQPFRTFVVFENERKDNKGSKLEEFNSSNKVIDSMKNTHDIF